MLKTKHVQKGDWRTMEFFWNAKGTAFFKAPAGAKIRVIYGGGIFSSKKQKQTLDGQTYKKLSVGKASLVTARMQILVQFDTDVTYEVHPGGIAVLIPKEQF